MALIQCKECGAMVSDQAENCPKCGSPIAKNSSVGQQPAYQQVTPTQPSYQTTDPQDAPNGGLNVLSLFFPLVGWILYFVYKDKTPIKAKSCAKFAWIGFAISVVFGFISGLAG